jgi:hypothetical protein
MSTHYRISQFNGDINDVVATVGVNPQTVMTGDYIIRVPAGVPVVDPTNLADLLTKKYAGLLGTSGLFTQVAYDDMLDDSGVDYATSNGIVTGDNGTIGLYPTAPGTPAPVLRTDVTNISWGGAGSGPAQAILTYELFDFVDSDNKSLPFQRSYREVTPDVDVDVEVSFDNGATFLTTLDKALITISPANQGDEIIVRFTRVTDLSARGRVFIGSWAVLF